MRILIIGAGAMGGLFGAMLSRVAEVVLCTTNAAHAQAIRRDGLAVTGLDGTVRRAMIGVLADPAPDSATADLVLICTKARATGEAARTAATLVAEDGLVLTLQNGLGNVERIAAEVGGLRAAAGITAQAATLLAPGHVRHAGSGPTVLAAGPGQAKKIGIVAALFNRAGIDTRITEDREALLWSKLVVNVGINALAALLRVPNGVLSRTAEVEPLMRQAVAEAEAVAGAFGVRLPPGQQLERVLQVCERTAGNRASMLQDILRGVATEIEVINGAVVARGRDAGVATPVNLLLTQLIRALEATASQRI